MFLIRKWHAKKNSIEKMKALDFPLSNFFIDVFFHEKKVTKKSGHIKNQVVWTYFFVKNYKISIFSKMAHSTPRSRFCTFCKRVFSRKFTKKHEKMRLSCGKSCFLWSARKTFFVRICENRRKKNFRGSKKLRIFVKLDS